MERSIERPRPVYHRKEQGISTKLTDLVEDPNPELETCNDYMEGLIDHTGRTFFEGVQQLGMGEKIRETGEIESVELFQESQTKPESIVEQNIESLNDSNLVVPVSGGLDSSILASRLDSSARLVHASFDFETGDERYVEILEDFTESEVKRIEFTSEDLFESVEEYVRTIGEPPGSPATLAVFMMYREIAGKYGDSTIVSGLGADEAFYGYPHFLPNYLKQGFQEQVFEGLRQSWLHRYNYRYIEGLKMAVKEFLTSKKYPGVKERRDDHVKRFYFPHLAKSTFLSAKAFGHKIECPFLDSRLFSTRPEECYRDGFTKYPLRSHFEEYLPERILKRREKTGFIHGFKASEEVRTVVEEVFHDERFKSREFFDGGKFQKRLSKGDLPKSEAFRAYSLEVWFRTWIDSPTI